MKKNTFVKILVTIIALAAVIAGAIAIYKRFFCESDDIDYDLDDDLDEEDIKPAAEAKRGYVFIPLDGDDDNEAESSIEDVL